MEKNILLLIMIVLFSCSNNPIEENRPAQVETLDTQEITDITAVCKGKITDKGTGLIVQYGIELNDGSGYTKHPRTISSANDFGVHLVGLSPDKTYHYRAYIDDGTVQYGAEKTFTTLSAFVYTASIDPNTITSNSAVVSFALVNHLKEWGFHYSETEVTQNDPVIKEFLKADVTLARLKKNTQYTILPYVKDKSDQIAYLEKITFTTEKEYANIELADPTIFLDNGTYYLYGTLGDHGFYVYTSSDLIDWEGPAGVRDGYALRSGDSFGNHWFWAPQIFKYNNDLYMAYAAEEKIAVAKSNSPLGPFSQSPPFWTIPSSTTQIDPYIFIDDDGKRYMYHVRFVVNRPYEIYVAEINESFSAITSDPILCVNAQASWELSNPNNSVTEGPTVIKHNGYYYLFYSANPYFFHDYSVGYATSTSPTGPWTKYAGNPIISKNSVTAVGIGHGDILEDKDGNYKYVFHIHPSLTSYNPRQTAIVDLEFVASGSGPDIVKIKNESYRQLRVTIP